MNRASRRRSAEDFIEVQRARHIKRFLSLEGVMGAKVLALIAALMSVGCPADIGEECGEDASSIAHASVLCEEGSVCVDGICVESRKEGEQCVVGEKSYTCDNHNTYCEYSIKRSGYFCIKIKFRDDFCDLNDGDSYCVKDDVCLGDEVLQRDANDLIECKRDLYCINNVCQKSKNEGSKCYIGDEHSCLEIFNCIPNDMSILIPLSETTLNTIDRTNGVCSPLAQRGEPCDLANYIKCADGLTCNTNNVCEEVR